MGRGHWVGFLGRDPTLAWVSSHEYLVFPSRMGQGPQPFSLWASLRRNRHQGAPWQGVPELVLKAQLGADKAPRHNWWGAGAASKLSARVTRGCRTAHA